VADGIEDDGVEEYGEVAKELGLGQDFVDDKGMWGVIEFTNALMVA